MADVGRPPKLTEATVSKLEEVFALDGTVEEACLFADISRTTYYEWIKENPKLADRFEELRQTPFLKARRTVDKSLDSPDGARWFLERKRKKEFAQRTEVTGEEGNPLIPTAEIDKKAEEAVKKFLGK